MTTRLQDAAATPFALEMLGITKRFPGVLALSDVTIQVRRRQVHALVGENGAGKSTLMKILDGVYAAGTFQGSIRLDGRPIAMRSPADAKTLGIGYVPQEITVLDNLTVAENVFVGAWNGRGARFVRFPRLFDRAAALLERNGIQLDPRRAVATLNASQRQLVMIARALADDPVVLILDEATACLTRDESRTLFRIVERLRDRGMTTVLITHKLAELFEIADRATVLRDGTVAAEFDRSAFDERRIVAAMIGRTLDAFYPTRDSRIGDGEAIRVERITVPHPHVARRNVVEDVSFSVWRGEILGLGGLVGSGRSEVVNAIYGRIPSRGSVWVDGRKVVIRNSFDAKRHGIGLLTEDRKRDGLLLDKSIRENVSLHDLRRISRFGIIDRARELDAARAFVRKLSIRAPHVETPVSTLSGGNQQKVVLSKTLFAGPRVLLLDEPTKGVDVGAKYEIYRLMMDLAREGIAQILITSDLPELLALCDRFLVLARGRVADTFTKSEASDARLMLAATGG